MVPVSSLLGFGIFSFRTKQYNATRQAEYVTQLQRESVALPQNNLYVRQAEI